MTPANEKESNIISSGESDTNNIEVKDKDEDNNLNLHINEKIEDIDKEDEPVLQNLDLLASEITTGIEICKENGKLEDKLDESSNVQAITISECETADIDLNKSAVKDNNNENETKYMEYSSCDAKDTNEIEKYQLKDTIVIENNDHNSEQTKEILSDNCDNKQTKDMSEQENDVKYDTKSSPEEEINSVIPSSTDVCYIAKQNDELRSEDEALKEQEDLATEDKTAVTDDKINTDDKQNITKCINETQERTDNERENNIANSIVVDKIESLKEDLHVEKEKAASSDQN